MKTLGAGIFIRNGCRFDYPFIESIQNMCNNCDEVYVVGIETDDDTIKEIEKLSEKNKNLLYQVVPDSEWEKLKSIGSERLSHFQNKAIENLHTDYIYYQQADEVASDESWKYIREAMEENGDAYMVTRINLWQSPYLMLNVPQERKPCSTSVCRLAKRGTLTYSDGENFAPTFCYIDYVDKINILHYGFIRKKEVHVEKITQMQRDIFLTTPDAKLEGMVEFDGSKWFGPEDLVPLNVNHPKIMHEWVKTRP